MIRESLLNLGVSSVAWDPEADAEIMQLLTRRGVRSIDLTPTKYFSWDDDEILSKSKQLASVWRDAGFEIRGIQSLVFGRDAWNIFDVETWPDFINHFNLLGEVSSALGANKLVFGSPKNRSKGDLANPEANATAADFFSRVSRELEKFDLELMIEPNPPEYGCDFLISTAAALDFVSGLRVANIKVQLDLGTCIYAGENPLELTTKNSNEIGYVHLATKMLKPLHLEANPLVEEFVKGYRGSLACTIEQRPASSDQVGDLAMSLDWLYSI